MSIQRTTRILVVTALLTLFGCDAIVLDRPLGKTPTQIEALNLDGIWYVVEKNPQPFFARLEPDGTLQIAGVETKDSGFELAEISLFIGKVSNGLFVSGKESDEDSRFHFAKIYEFTDAKLVLLLPDVTAFAAAIEGGELSGTVDELESVTTVSVEADVMAEFLSSEAAFGIWDNAVVMIVRRFGSEFALEQELETQ